MYFEDYNLKPDAASRKIDSFAKVSELSPLRTDLMEVHSFGKDYK